MHISLMVFASPIFLLLIGIECAVSLYKRKALYHLNDTVNNFSAGIVEEVGILPIRGLLLFSYFYSYEHYAFFQINTHSPLAWIALWIGVDFTYYWIHRACHRCNLFWMGHSVHHQSEHYNLSVALRQGYFQYFFTWYFYLPLAFIGFPTWMFVTMSSLNTIYQFWIHTPSIKKMGWLEHFLNTPSHHRVHHGQNPQYIDKNYAGSLIIWDKLFGTFAPENEPVHYGVTEPLDSWNPFYANIKVLKDLAYYGKGFKNKLNLILALFMPPEWIINQLKNEGAPITKRNPMNKHIKTPKWYMIFNTMFAVFLYAYLSFTFKTESIASWFIIGLTFLTLYILGRVLNGHTKIQFMELGRAIILLTSLYLITNNTYLAFATALVFMIGNHLIYTSKPWAQTETSHDALPLS